MVRLIPKPLKILVSCAFADAGDTIRSVTIARAIRKLCPKHIDLHIEFLSCGGQFEHQITDAGFNIRRAEPRVVGRSVAEDLGWAWPEFFDKEKAKRFIEGQHAAFQRLKPDVVLHGMWPPASLAARSQGIPTINFLPIPLHPVSFRNGLISDLPDRVPLLSRLSRGTRSRIAEWVPKGLLLRFPIFHQRNLGAAAHEYGWPGEGPISLFDMNMADLNLVNDLPIFYQKFAHLLPDNIKITGSIYSSETKPLPEDVDKHMNRKSGAKILVAMGSSGKKEWIFEAIKALIMNPSDDWNAVVLAPSSACSLDEACAVGKNDPRLLITDRFISAMTASVLADVLITHGGQGTVQTGLAANTPLVGVALQMEQQINLDHVMDYGAGIRIQQQRWEAANIREAVKTILDHSDYTANATELGSVIRNSDGAIEAALEVWKLLLKRDDRSVSKR